MFGQIERTKAESPVRCQYVAGQQHEQRRRIDAAVVAAERDLAESPPSRLRAPRAGSCRARRRAPGRSSVACVRGQEAQHAARQRRVDPQASRAPSGCRRGRRCVEYHGTPAYGYGPGRQLGGQHGEVGARALAATWLTSGFDVSMRQRLLGRAARRARAAASARLEAARPAAPARLRTRTTRARDQLALARGASASSKRAGCAVADGGAADRSADARAPRHAVEAAVGQHDGVAATSGWQQLPRRARCMPRTSNRSAKVGAERRSPARTSARARRRSSSTRSRS